MSHTGAPGVVLVTGVSRYLGAHLAARLASDPRIRRVIGVDSLTPSEDLQMVLDGVEVCCVDLRTPEITKVLLDAEVEAVAHLAVATVPDASTGGRQAMKELNIIGTMQLLASCQRVPTLSRLLVRSSTAAYGASFRDRAVFTEEVTPFEIPRGCFARDVIDIETYVRSFRRRCPLVESTVLRLATLIGPHTRTAMARYLTQPVVPTVFGRDPRLQFLHVDDAFEILYRSVVESHPGTFNVAGSGVMTLSQAIRRLGRVGMPTPELGLNAAATIPHGRVACDITLDQLELLIHGRVVDVSRLVEEYGYEPRSTVDAFADFVRTHTSRAPLSHTRVCQTERFVVDRLQRARRIIRGLR